MLPYYLYINQQSIFIANRKCYWWQRSVFNEKKNIIKMRRQRNVTYSSPVSISAISHYFQTPNGTKTHWMRNKNYYCSFVFAKFKSVINFPNHSMCKCKWNKLNNVNLTFWAFFTDILSNMCVSVRLCVRLFVCRQVKFLYIFIRPNTFHHLIYMTPLFIFQIFFVNLLLHFLHDIKE